VIGAQDVLLIFVSLLALSLVVPSAAQPLTRSILVLEQSDVRGRSMRKSLGLPIAGKYAASPVSIDVEIWTSVVSVSGV